MAKIKELISQSAELIIEEKVEEGIKILKKIELFLETNILRPILNFDKNSIKKIVGRFEVPVFERNYDLLGIIVEKEESAEKVNSVLHEYSSAIIGRMGIPYRRRGVSIISIALDAPQDKIAALSGKIGRLDGVSVKTAYSGVISKE